MKREDGKPLDQVLRMCMYIKMAAGAQRDCHLRPLPDSARTVRLRERERKREREEKIKDRRERKKENDSKKYHLTQHRLQHYSTYNTHTHTWTPAHSTVS